MIGPLIAEFDACLLTANDRSDGFSVLSEADHPHNAPTRRRNGYCDGRVERDGGLESEDGIELPSKLRAIVRLAHDN